MLHWIKVTVTDQSWCESKVSVIDRGSTEYRKCRFSHRSKLIFLSLQTLLIIHYDPLQLHWYTLLLSNETHSSPHNCSASSDRTSGFAWNESKWNVANTDSRNFVDYHTLTVRAAKWHIVRTKTSQMYSWIVKTSFNLIKFDSSWFINMT